MSGRTKPAQIAYQLLKEAAESGRALSTQDVCDVTGWAPSTVATYRTKKWRDHINLNGESFTVKKQFLRLAESQFMQLHTQNTRTVGLFERARYEVLVSYELLLPLTREAQLRDALDALFYQDTIERRLREIAGPDLDGALQRQSDEDDEHFFARALEFVSSHFGGYSLGHVSGRFRAAPLQSRAGAGALLAADQRYLIDETTAVVRFFVPVHASREEGGRPNPTPGGGVPPDGRIQHEIVAIEHLFFELFVEAVVETVKGEEEIWLVQLAPVPRLFVWERAEYES